MTIYRVTAVTGCSNRNICVVNREKVGTINRVTLVIETRFVEGNRVRLKSDIARLPLRQISAMTKKSKNERNSKKKLE